VLIVDDNAQNLELLSAYIEEIPGITLVQAPTARKPSSGGRKAADVILLDDDA